jgi:FdhE protein
VSKDEPLDALGELEESLERLAALEGQEHTSDELCRFLAATARAHARVRKRLGPTPLELDPSLLSDLLQELVAGAPAGNRAAPLRLLERAAAEDPGLLQRLARAAISAPDTAALPGLTAPEVLRLGQLLAAPFVQAYVRQTGAKRKHPDNRRCPRCGGPPALAVLRRDHGQRELICALCALSRPVARLECPTCGCSDAAQLGVLRLDDDDPRWLEVCDGCGHYVKTVDAKRLPAGEPVLLLVEEAESVYLDLLGTNEGYQASHAGHHPGRP